MSKETRAIVAAKMVVKPPTQATVHRATGSACANSGYDRATRKTPALTIVAAWMRADTGVGPSIASGSQTWSGNWALLPIAPAKIRSATTAIGIGNATRVWLVRTSIEPRMLSV